jgi:hypothetical protein
MSPRVKLEDVADVHSFLSVATKNGPPQGVCVLNIEKSNAVASLTIPDFNHS